MKEISGDDFVNIRGAGDKETISEKFNCVMVLATNEVAEIEQDRDNDSFPSRFWCFDFCNKFERDSSIVDKLNADIHAYFTVLTQYAKTHYYDKNKLIRKCKEVERFTQKICDDQDTVKWWCKRQPYEAGEKGDYVEKTQLFERYKSDCAHDKKKNVVGKTEFYEAFQDFYGVGEAVQIKYKNLSGNVVKILGYRYIKEVSEVVDNDEEIDE